MMTFSSFRQHGTIIFSAMLLCTAVVASLGLVLHRSRDHSLAHGSCGATEAKRELATKVAAFAASGWRDALFVVIEAAGDAPPGYHRRPDAERTPPTASVLRRFDEDPAAIAGMQRLCEHDAMPGSRLSHATPAN